MPWKHDWFNAFGGKNVAGRKTCPVCGETYPARSRYCSRDGYEFEIVVDTYPIFINYRREGGIETAILLKSELASMTKLAVFLDIEELHVGPFPEQLVKRITEADFVLAILSADFFERCVNPGDWVAKEIDLAVRLGKCIIPVFLKGFTPPSPELRSRLPETVARLCDYEGVMYNPLTLKTVLRQIQKLMFSKANSRFGNPEQASADESMPVVPRLPAGDAKRRLAFWALRALLLAGMATSFFVFIDMYFANYRLERISAFLNPGRTDSTAPSYPTASSAGASAFVPPVEPEPQLSTSSAKEIQDSFIALGLAPPDLPAAMAIAKAKGKAGTTEKKATIKAPAKAPVALRAEPGPTRIRLTSTPPGAEVLVNFSKKGITPLDAPLPNRNNKIIVRMMGYVRYETTLPDTTKERNLHVELMPVDVENQTLADNRVDSTPAPSPLVSIASEPPGAEVLVNFSKKGITPLQIRLPNRSNKIIVRMPGYIRFETILPDTTKERNLHVELKPEVR